MLGKERAVVAVLNDALRFAQLNQRAVVGVDAPRVARCRLGVDFRVVRIHAQPRRAARESRLRARRPLHRRARVVAAARPQQFVNGRHVAPRCFFDDVEVGAFDVAVVGDVVEVGVGHADFFALIDVRRAAQHVQRACQHGRGLNAVAAVIAEAAQGARLVVVVPKERVPGIACRHAGLPVADEGFQGGEVEGLQRPFLLVFVVHFEVVEGEDAR